MSNKKVGQVLKLFISTQGTSQRTDKPAISLTELGVLKDKFYNKNVERSVLISSIDSYSLVNKHNITMPFGYLGENILIDYNPYSLEVGTRLKIGDAVLEITQYCTICNHLAVIDENIPDLLRDDRGIFAKVVSAGKINSSDEVYIV